MLAELLVQQFCRCCAAETKLKWSKFLGADWQQHTLVYAAAKIKCYGQCAYLANDIYAIID
jgi:hypothetical protein